MTDKLKLSFKTIVLPASGTEKPLTFLIIDMSVRLMDLGQKEYVRAWMRQLRIAQTTDNFNLHDAIIALEVGKDKISQKRNGGVS